MKKLLTVILFLFIVNIGYSQIYPFAYWKSGTAAVVYEQNADSLFARMTSAGSTPSTARKSLINTTIKMLKDSLGITSLYQAFDLFYVLAARDTLQARLNWVNSSYTLTGVRTNTAGAWVADSGYRGLAPGTKVYLKTGYIPNTNKVTFAYNSSTIGGWALMNLSTVTYSLWGVYSDSWTYREWMAPTSTGLGLASHVYTQILGAPPVSSGAGLFHIVTPDADSVVSYRNGERVHGHKRGSSVSSTLASRDIWLLATNGDGVGEAFSANRICFFYLGKKTTALEARKIYNILKYYLDNAPSNT